MATKHGQNPDHGPDDSLIRNAEVSYEHRDMGARGILLFLVVLAISGVAIHLLIWGMYAGMQKYAEANDPQLHPLAPADKLPPRSEIKIVPANVPVYTEKFPQPRLQTDDTSDMRTFLKQEDRMLTAGPWKDEAGVVHLPIDRAMELVVQRGLPARAATPVESSDQTESGNVAMSEGKKSSDAVSVRGAPKSEAGAGEKKPH